MVLRGDLASVDLAQVFQMLALNQKVGLLSIRSKQLWKVLYFDQRGVTVHHNVHAVLDRVARAFVRAGRITEQALEEVRDHAARTGQSLVDGLLAGGYLNEQELADQYRFELEEEAYDLFFCRDAKFEFFEGATEVQGFDGKTDTRFFFNCDSVVMEAARRIDEWTYIAERVPSTDGFYVTVADSIDPEEYGSDATAMFERLDGRRSVARVAELTNLTQFQSCKALSQLLDAGLVAPVAADDFLALADECRAEGRLADAIDLYQHSVDLGLGLPDVHARAASALQQGERYEDAAEHLQALAQHLESVGDRAGAAQRLLEIARLLPTHLGARSHLVELALANNLRIADYDAFAEGKQLVDLLLEFGDIEKVRALLERLLLVEPDDVDLKKALVGVHIKAGDQQRVAELYEAIAEDLVAAGRPLDAVGYLQKILMMDRSRSDVSERVRQLYEYDERSRRRHRSLGVLAMLFSLLVGLGAFYWYYNERAQAEFNRIDVSEAVAREDFAGATMAYTEFSRRFPLTTPVVRAEGEIQQIEALRQRFEARRANDRAAHERELQRLRADYKREWEAQRELFLGGKTQESLAAIGRVRELLAKAGGAEDMSWALEQQVERTWQRLTEYLATSEQLAKDSAAALAAGDWQRARELAVKLKSEYENTPGAARTPVPVHLTTRPAGAQLQRDGKPLEHEVAGVMRPLVTPCVLMCDSLKQPCQVTATLPGFDPLRLAVVAADQPQLDVVLAIVPGRRVPLQAALQTGIGAGEGWLAFGMRGGRLGVARTDGAENRVLELGGLKAVDGTPQIQNGRVFYATNENTIECLSLEAARSADGWPVTLGAAAATELCAAEGRLLVIDGNHILHCWEQASGALLWSLSLDSAPSGPPTVFHRQVAIGTNDGRVLFVDASDGSALGVLKTGQPITTRVLADDGIVVFGTAPGVVNCVARETGELRWQQALGSPVVDGCVAVTPQAVCARLENGFIAFDRGHGRELARREVEGQVQPGLQLRDSTLFLRSSLPRVRNLPQRDLLVAFDTGTWTVQWEFESATSANGGFGVSPQGVAFPGAADEIVVFR